MVSLFCLNHLKTFVVIKETFSANISCCTNFWGTRVGNLNYNIASPNFTMNHIFSEHLAKVLTGF